MPDSSAVAMAAAALRERWAGFAPEVALQLGSGLGGATANLQAVIEIPYAELPGFSPPTVAGHAGKLVAGLWHGRRIVALHGRMHLYEGHAEEVSTVPLRALHALGAKLAVLTNMSGGIEPGWPPGTLMAMAGHLDLQRGLPRPLPEPMAADGSPYSPSLRAMLHEAARAAGVDLREGLYAAMLGPMYETPAEVRMLARLGCQAVGMSTVTEARAVQRLGMGCVALSCIANHAAGVAAGAIDHADVLAAARGVVAPLGRLLDAFVARLRFEEA